MTTSPKILHRESNIEFDLNYLFYGTEFPTVSYVNRKGEEVELTFSLHCVIQYAWRMYITNKMNIRESYSSMDKFLSKMKSVFNKGHKVTSSLLVSNSLRIHPDYRSVYIGNKNWRFVVSPMDKVIITFVLDGEYADYNGEVEAYNVLKNSGFFKTKLIDFSVRI